MWVQVPNLWFRVGFFLAGGTAAVMGLYQRARFCPLVALYFEVTPLYLAPISLLFVALSDRLRSYDSVT